MHLRTELRRSVGLLVIVIGLYPAIFGGMFAFVLALYVTDDLQRGDWDGARHAMPDLLTLLAGAGAGIAIVWLGVRIVSIKQSWRRENEG